MDLLVKELGLSDYVTTWHAMKSFIASANQDTKDELWITEHNPVYTLGYKKNKKNVINHNIDIVETDRGGDITFHGPEQIIFYPLLNLKRANIKLLDLVVGLENLVIQILSNYDIKGKKLNKNPGVFVNNYKIASVGIRVKQPWCYHGLSFNINVDTSYFDSINACGLDIRPINLSSLSIYDKDNLKKDLILKFKEIFGYTV
jgi:lipoyl(octanoyl) transferase